MKIAIPANSPGLEARVEQRFGLSAYLVIVNPQTMSVEAVPSPGTPGQRGAGIQTVVLAISKEVDVVLTGFCSPTAMKYLADNGIDVVTGVNGTVAEAVAQYQKQVHSTPMRNKNNPEITGVSLMDGLKRSGRQIGNLLPILVGVVLLLGLFNTFISKELLLSIFSGNMLPDILWGTGFGSILAGNPINSYVIGGELLKYGVNLFAVTAFITAWVTIGLVQLPAEIAALGKKFALIRNTLSIFLCIAISILTVFTYNAIMRGVQ